MIKQKSINSYTSDVNKIIKIISYDKNIMLSGSNSLRNFLYPVDYDFFNVVSEHSTKEEATKHIMMKLYNIVKMIKENKDLYLMDFKAGSDDRLKILEEECGVFQRNRIENYNPSKLEAIYKRLKSEKLIKDDIVFPKKPTVKQWFELKDELRKLYTLRWNSKEIMEGRKKLNDGRIKTFYDALQDDMIIKIDIITTIDYKIVDVSNIYELYNNDDLRNQGLDIQKSLLNDVQKYYFTEQYYKMNKRIFNLAREAKDKSLMELLINLFNGELGILYLVISRYKTIIDLFEKYPHNNLFEICLKNIDMTKNLINNIFVINNQLENKLFEIINKIVELKYNDANVKFIMEVLEEIVEKLTTILNDETKNFNKKHGLYPLPSKYLKG
jgi:hypothetical protein